MPQADEGSVWRSVSAPCGVWTLEVGVMIGRGGMMIGRGGTMIGRGVDSVNMRRIFPAQLQPFDPSNCTAQACPDAVATGVTGD